MTKDHPIVKPFIDAGIETLGTMAMLGLEFCAATAVENFEDTLDYTSTMGLCGENEGLLVVSVGKPLLRTVVAAMLGDEEENVDDDLVDGAGELANMIAGAAKGALGDAGYHFELSIPAVIMGAKNVVSPQTAMKGVRIECACNGLPFVIGLWTGGLNDE
ncbi:MAG: chemotaxis protein CheX [Myxococcota bacterium]|jgi:chemotaxis protein CheX|nr:chemotaxis protein CheX [Myxococcota bacterium]